MSLFKRKKEKLELEVSEKHMGLRLALAAVFLVIGIGALGFFLIQLLSEEPGWQTIELSDNTVVSKQEFTFEYNLGQGELSATEEKRELQKAYSSAMERAYKLFDARCGYGENFVNMHYINLHPNQVLTVDPRLYSAFALLDSYDDRSRYLAPVQAQYRNLFSCTDDVTAATLDPYKNEETFALVGELTDFANDPSDISIELLDNYQIRLNVSDEYLSYLNENGIEILVDFSWMMNAFVVDCVSDELISKGFTRGYLLSYDGYARYLDADDNSYNIRIYDRVGNTVYPAAVAECKNVRSLAQFRDYPINTFGAADYYGYSDGSYASRYLGQNGLYQSASHDLVAYSSDKGCAEIALTASHIFIAENLDRSKLDSAAEQGIFTVWCEERVICSTDKAFEPTELYENGEIRYTRMPK